MQNNKTSMNNNSPNHQRTSSPHPQDLIHHKFKPKFNHRFAAWRCMMPSDISYINKYKPKVLSSVSISSLNSENIGTNGLRNLRKALTSSKRVSVLILESPEINAKQLTYLLDSTNHWKHFTLIDLQKSERMDRELIKTLPRLGRYKNLTNFPRPIHLIEQYVSGKTVRRFCGQLRALNKLKTLTLDIPLWNHPMILDYKPLRSITYLHLEFGNKSLYDKSQLSTFLSNIQKCSQLQNLSIGFRQNYLMEPSDAETWASFFENPPHLLKTLQLFLDFDATVQESEGVQIFMESLKQLKSLTTLKIDPHISTFTMDQPVKLLNTIFSSLLTSLQCLTQLETFIFTFLGFSHLKKKDIQNLSSTLQYLKNLKNLKLHLNLGSIGSPHESLIEIAVSLKQLINLQTLDLLLSPVTPFSPESVQTFSKSISQLPLTAFNLSLGSLNGMVEPILDLSAIKNGFGKIIGLFKNNEKPNLTPFFSDLSHFSLLSNLNLGLSAFKISHREFQHLSLALKHLQNLSSLRLDLSQFDPSNNFEGLRNLFSCLDDMPKLTNLALLFKGKISNQEVGILSSSLAGCQSLKYLSMDFQKASQLQDESLYFLLGALRNLLKLKDLSLLFEKLDLMNLLLNQNQEGFGEQAMSHFLQGLTVLKKLTGVKFIFNPLSVFQWNRAPLPPNLRGYKKLRQLTYFIVGNSRYI